jgi:hypothetical protein
LRKIRKVDAPVGNFDAADRKPRRRLRLRLRIAQRLEQAGEVVGSVGAQLAMQQRPIDAHCIEGPGPAPQAAQRKIDQEMAPGEQRATRCIAQIGIGNFDDAGEGIEAYLAERQAVIEALLDVGDDPVLHEIR